MVQEQEIVQRSTEAVSSTSREAIRAVSKTTGANQHFSISTLAALCVGGVVAVTSLVIAVWLWPALLVAGGALTFCAWAFHAHVENHRYIRENHPAMLPTEEHQRFTLTMELQERSKDARITSRHSVELSEDVEQPAARQLRAPVMDVPALEAVPVKADDHGR